MALELREAAARALPRRFAPVGAPPVPPSGDDPTDIDLRPLRLRIEANLAELDRILGPEEPDHG